MGNKEKSRRLPDWIKIKVQKGKHKAEVETLISSLGLNSVCVSAKCPNQQECWQNRTATFMILGNDCTRNCKFCSVNHNTSPTLPAVDEPEKIAQAVKRLELKYTVITSVTRDDLPDQGAGHFIKVIESIRQLNPNTKIEILTPDFNNDRDLIYQVLMARPDVFNHNIEMVKSLTDKVRYQATYKKSLSVLNFAANFPNRTFLVKSGFMVGLGESDEEVIELIDDLKANGVEILTIGQYLAPTRDSWPVDRYVEPELFSQWKEYALKIGFKAVASGPLVRSSYDAKELNPES